MELIQFQGLDLMDSIDLMVQRELVLVVLLHSDQMTSHCWAYVDRRVVAQLSMDLSVGPPDKPRGFLAFGTKSERGLQIMKTVNARQ